MNNKITRKSDKVKFIPSGLAGTLYCPLCNLKLYPVKNDTLNLMCHQCGDLFPIKSIKYPTQLTQVDSEPSTVVQNRNARRGIKTRPANPLQQELSNAGFQVIDSQYDDKTR